MESEMTDSLQTGPVAHIERTLTSDLQVITVSRSSLDDLFITAIPRPGEAAEVLAERAVRAALDREARVVRQDVFHMAAGREAVMGRLETVAGRVEWPVTWVEDGNGQASLTGTYLHAVCGRDVGTIRQRGRILGCIYSDRYARNAVLGDVRPWDTGSGRCEQAQQVFEAMAEGLAQVGMDFSHVVRTWFYNDDILAWYREFNQVRTEFFRARGVFGGVVPASTGIGARNPFGAALTGALIAAEAKTHDIRVRSVPSPLQCSAIDYGSSFSRAVELTTPEYRQLWVSGTASINSAGQTVHKGDIGAQVAHTMRVVEALLESRKINWANVVRCVAYMRNACDSPVLTNYCKDRGLPAFPVILTNNVICRDDLLFEIEVDAVGSARSAAAV